METSHDTDERKLGFFHCRFTERADIEGLGKLIRRFSSAGYMPYFHITGTTANSIMEQDVTIDDRTLHRMTTSRGMVPPFRMKEVTIRATNKAAKTNISLCFTKGTFYPLSGLPRCLHSDPSEYPVPFGRTGLKTTSSIRWASRSGSQRLQRRIDWKPPNLPPPLEKGDIISRYSEPSHLLGSATNLVSIVGEAHDLQTHREWLHSDSRPESPFPTDGRRDSRSPLQLPINTPSELPNNEIQRHELPALEAIQELPANEARTAPNIYMADEDWTDMESRSPTSIYMSLTLGDVLHVLEMPAVESPLGSVWRVKRPSDGREGWVPSRCLRRIEDVPPRRAQFDASPVDGVFW